MPNYEPQRRRDAETQSPYLWFSAPLRLCGSKLCISLSASWCPWYLGGFVLTGGEGGIRTHDEFPRTRFPGERPRPLGDLSLNEFEL